MQTRLTVSSTHAPALIRDLQRLNSAGYGLSVGKAIKMIDDLRQNGRNSRFVKFQRGDIYELKTRTPEGGMRVYFFFAGEDVALCRAELKREDKASKQLLDWAQERADAYAAGKEVLQ